ncbi:dihydrolipoyl dehydrogenase family protein [Pelagibacterium xiamenense]|uniref:dihydrolipoyl dehydrogenase family protein n=1 Tax=Pelagibacterium xiamenense TaxID=2901140 RepID=UPI001E319BFB|nr:NAD(P)/FAD-dependent oxidoreductase [Pelagibacterium xiamenense]MCD7058907.1 NAD(P)/FAD-dependent oxidoreductase [Pelagibacterium xiamenense]
MAETIRTDLCIIGGGPGGLAAAREARAAGAGVVLVEKGALGGVALNRGSLAAHATAAAAKRAHQMRTARDLGIGAEEPRVNFARLNGHIAEVIAAAAAEASQEQLAADGITVIQGAAGFIDAGTLKAGETQVRARRFVIATGSRPLVPDIPGLGDVPFHTPETIFELTRKPGHLIVLGGGETGLALAQAYLRLGVGVTLIDILEPLGDCDAELTAIVLRRLKAEGLNLMSNTGVVSVSGTEGEIALEVKSGAEERQIGGTHLLVAAGRRPDLDGLGLGHARVRTTGGQLELNAFGRTSNRRIYALGATAGDARSVHAVRHQARQIVGHALGGMFGVRTRPAIPHVVYTDPEIAQVGLTEVEARSRHKARFTITRFPFAAIDRARALGETEGHVKLITHESGRILGAGIAGPAAGELIALFALAVAKRLTPHDLQRLVVPHPALAEIVPALAGAYAETYAEPGWRQRVAKTLGPLRAIWR